VYIERKKQRDLLEEKAKKRRSAIGTKNPEGQGGPSTNNKTKASTKRVAFLVLVMTFSKEVWVR
jgi:hypothetical protein